MRLAIALAGRFVGRGEPREDLNQVALLALVGAARRFDPDRHIAFSSFATVCVLGEIKRYFRDKTWAMKTPRPLQETYLNLKEARDHLSQQLGASPTVTQIADWLQVPEEKVYEAMEAGSNYSPESLDAPRPDRSEEGTQIAVIDAGFDRSLGHLELVRHLRDLTWREQLVIMRLYFDGHTQKQVADELDVSQMQVSRIRRATLEKLRQSLA